MYSNCAKASEELFMYGLQLNNSKGSALLMVSMLGIVSGGVLFSLFSDFNSSAKIQKQLYDKSLYSFFIADIQKQLSWPDQCYAALQSQKYNLSQSNPVSLQNIAYKAFPAIKKDLKLGANLIVSDIVLSSKSSSEFSRGEFVLNGSVKKWARDSSARLTTRVAQLLITVKSNFKYSFKVIPINLFVNVDSSNRIRSCYTELSVAYICENLKNVWNARRSICEPYKQCFYAKASPCQIPYSTYLIGGSSFGVCEWCNPNAP